MKAKHKPEIEQLKRRYKQLHQEAREIYLKLMEAGAWPLDDDELDGVAGGHQRYIPSDDEIGEAPNQVFGPDGQPTDVLPGGGGGNTTGNLYDDLNSKMNNWFSNHVMDPTDNPGSFY